MSIPKSLATLPQLRNIVILTGAGVSKESGLNTFRDPGGLWESHRPEEVATPEAYKENPGMVQRFYNFRRQKVIEANPNAAHHALVKLEKGLKDAGLYYLLVTQNIDDLHDRAGSERLIHMHGEICQVRCVKTGEVFPWRDPIVLEETVCPCCQLTGTLRPNVVWFGEMPFQMKTITAALSQADLFIAIGTSGTVYPAAGFVQETPQQALTIEVNFEDTAKSWHFDEKRVGPATETVPILVEEILARIKRPPTAT